MRLNSEVKMYDNDDNRVIKIVIDYANRNGHDIQADPRDLALSESDFYGEDSVVIIPFSWASPPAEKVTLNDVTVDQIVTDALLDLLAKGQ